MKIVFIFIISSFFSLNSFAALKKGTSKRSSSSSSTSSQTKQSVEDTKRSSTDSPVNENVEQRRRTVTALPNLKGLGVFAHYDLADSFDFDGNVNNQSINGNTQTGSAFGIGAEYLLTELDNGIAIAVGGSYEFSRSFSKTNYSIGKVKETATYSSPKPEIVFWTTYANLSLQLTPRITAFGGGNYNFINGKNINGTYKGKLGFQGGLSYLFNEKIAVAGVYRTLNFSFSNDEISLDNSKLQGFLFEGHYLF